MDSPDRCPNPACTATEKPSKHCANPHCNWWMCRKCMTYGISPARYHIPGQRPAA